MKVKHLIDDYLSVATKPPSTDPYAGWCEASPYPDYRNHRLILFRKINLKNGYQSQIYMEYML